MNKIGGWIQVICGPMFSGKTEELLKIITLSLIARQQVQVFKPKIDNRYAKEHVVSHSNRKIPCIRIKKSEEILDLIEDSTRVVAIDECQFMDSGIVNVCEKLATRGLRVVIAGLDQDSNAVPFGPMPALLAIADSVLKSHAVCMVCGNEATKTQRLTKESGQVLVGGNKKYEARCRAHHRKDV